jgi:ABC-type polysaccharide/polyol phosphate transport system ATPase subunit
MSLHTVHKPMNTTKPAPLSQDSAILLENVSVRYRVPSEGIGTFKEYAIRWLQRRLKKIDFWALRGVNMEIRKGEVFGVIGHNGAGKSTLFKLIARVLQPVEGRVVIRGHVAPLLELGAGFHPELSGRENVFLNGAVLGFSYSEMQRKFPSIVAFSELESFIDSPLRTYSSGMYARLGFAVATDTRPDILLIDEILAVGDEGFQRKCIERIMGFREQGSTILIVAHSMDTIRMMCQRVAWIHHGVLQVVGEPDHVIDCYRASQH